MKNAITNTINNGNNHMNIFNSTTAIKIAKDALDSITAAGYNVTMEEVDGLTDYQIIIKVEK